MRLHHIEIHASDPTKSQKFYEDVLGFSTESVQGGGKYIWMKLDEVSILIRPGKSGVSGKAFAQSAGNLVLCCEDPVATLKLMQGKGLTVRGHDDGCPTFTDPDGNWFQLIGLDGTFPG